MPRFLAVYTIKPEDVARFRALPKSEQDAIDAVGVKQWAEWEKSNAAAIIDPGVMVGKTKRVTRDEIADATNPFCGYIIIEARTIEDAARLFTNHPHITVFPGDGIDIMPVLTGPGT